MKTKDLKMNRKDLDQDVNGSGTGGTLELLVCILNWMWDILNATRRKGSNSFHFNAIYWVCCRICAHVCEYISERACLHINLHPSHWSKTGQHLKFPSYIVSGQEFLRSSLKKRRHPDCSLAFAANRRARWKTRSCTTPTTPPSSSHQHHPPFSSSIHGASDVPTMRRLLGRKKKK